MVSIKPIFIKKSEGIYQIISIKDLHRERLDLVEFILFITYMLTIKYANIEGMSIGYIFNKDLNPRLIESMIDLSSKIDSELQYIFFSENENLLQIKTPEFNIING
jgi:hypothetical protein